MTVWQYNKGGTVTVWQWCIMSRIVLCYLGKIRHSHASDFLTHSGLLALVDVTEAHHVVRVEAQLVVQHHKTAGEADKLEAGGDAGAVLVII